MGANQPGRDLNILATRLIWACHHDALPDVVGFLAGEAESALRHVFAAADFRPSVVVVNQDGKLKSHATMPAVVFVGSIGSIGPIRILILDSGLRLRKHSGFNGGSLQLQ